MVFFIYNISKGHQETTALGVQLERGFRIRACITLLRYAIISISLSLSRKRIIDAHIVLFHNTLIGTFITLEFKKIPVSELMLSIIQFRGDL